MGVYHTVSTKKNTPFLNKNNYFCSFFVAFLKNVQDLDARKPFIYKAFSKGLNKLVSSIELDYYSFSSLPHKSIILYHVFTQTHSKFSFPAPNSKWYLIKPLFAPVNIPLSISIFTLLPLPIIL